MKKAAIVIPIYKQNLTENEKKSFSQCAEILNKYPIIFVCPINLDTTLYENFCESMNVHYEFKKFNNKFFKGLREYSKLLLDINFYKKFSEYEYILIYQLDAWVFADNLEYWCNKGYDYIGAPWFEGLHLANENSKLLEVAGNGGFSLRKVDSIINVLKIWPIIPKIKYIMTWDQVFNKYKKRQLISNILNLPKYLCIMFGYKNLAFYHFKNYNHLYEDIFFTNVIPKLYPDFKLAPPEVAMYFSFEVLPEKLYKMTNHTLPFGCHSYEKYNYEFWKQFIK